MVAKADDPARQRDLARALEVVLGSRAEAGLELPAPMAHREPPAEGLDAPTPPGFELLPAAADLLIGVGRKWRAHESQYRNPNGGWRTAGRGRGLGLPIAWRLVRQQGGDVRLAAPRPQEPTRFLVALPRVTVPAVEPSHHLQNGTAVEC